MKQIRGNNSLSIFIMLCFFYIIGYQCCVYFSIGLFYVLFLFFTFSILLIIIQYRWFFVKDTHVCKRGFLIKGKQIDISLIEEVLYRKFSNKVLLVTYDVIYLKLKDGTYVDLVFQNSFRKNITGELFVFFSQQNVIVRLINYEEMKCIYKGTIARIKKMLGLGV